MTAVFEIKWPNIMPLGLLIESVVAIIVFGDPTHVAEAPYNRGTSQKNGVCVLTVLRPCSELMRLGLAA